MVTSTPLTRRSNSLPAGPVTADTPRIRHPIAVVVSRFPKLTETFILRELEELERQAQPVELVPLLRHGEDVIHEDARSWIPRAWYTPFLSPRILASNLRAMATRPVAFLTLAARLAAGSARQPGMLARTMILFPKAVYLGERLARAGVGHLHAHFASHPATVAMVASELWGLTFSFTAHAHDLFVSQALLDQKLRRARFVRSISDFNRRFLEERFPEASVSIHVIPMGLEPERFRVEPALRHGEPLLLCVAALEPKKGHEVLIEACHLLEQQGRTFRCELVGGGALAGSLRERIDRLGLGARIRLVGPLPQKAVAERIASATAVLLSSVVTPNGRMEGLPVVLVEALAAGRPVVAPELSGIPELIEDGVTGLLFRPGDSRQLAAALGRLLDDPRLAERLGRAGRQRVEERFELSRTVGSLLDVLDPENAPPQATAADLARLGADLVSATALGVEGWIEGPDSRIVLGLVAGSPPQRVVVKEHRERSGSPPAARRARQEALCLERIAAALDGEPTLRVPRLLASRPSAGVLLMSRVSGVAMRSLIRRARWRENPELSSAFRRAGEWLAAVQGRVDAARIPPSWRPVERIAEDLEQLRRAGRLRGFSLDDLELDSLDSQNGTRPVAVHGDFWPGNVYVDGATVTVLDLEGTTTGPPWYDPAWFLVHARLFFAWPGLARRFRALEAAFLDGLAGHGGPSLATADLLRGRALVAVRRLAKEPAKPPGPRSWLRRRVLLRELRGARR